MNGDTTKTDMRSEIIYLVAAATDGRLPNLIESEPWVDLIMIDLVAYCCSMVASPRRNISHDPPGSGFSEVGTLTLTLSSCFGIIFLSSSYLHLESGSFLVSTEE